MLETNDYHHVIWLHAQLWQTVHAQTDQMNESLRTNGGWLLGTDETQFLFSMLSDSQVNLANRVKWIVIYLLNKLVK